MTRKFTRIPLRQRGPQIATCLITACAGVTMTGAACGTVAPPNPLVGPTCFGAFSQGEIDETTQMTSTMIAASRQAAHTGVILLEAVERLATLGATVVGGDPPPDDARFEFKDGAYVLDFGGGTNRTRLSLRHFYGPGLGNHGVGEPIEHDLFLLDNYARNLRFDASSLTSIKVTFDEPGPLVELLGLGPNPNSGVEVPILSVLQLFAPILKIHWQLALEVSMDDGDGITMAYVLRTPRNEVGDPLGMDFRFSLEEWTGSWPERNQTLSVSSFDLSPNVWGTGIRGHTEFEVRGDSRFDYTGRLDFDNDVCPIVTLECLDLDEAAIPHSYGCLPTPVAQSLQDLADSFGTRLVTCPNPDNVPECMVEAAGQMASDLPLDVVFVFDLSGSMWDDISVVKRAVQIVMDGIGQLVPDRALGVGVFRTGGDTPLAEILGDLTSSVAEATRTVDTIRLDAEYWQEAALEGVLEAINEISWRPGSTRVVVLLTDEVIQHPGPGGVTLQDVVDAALARGVIVVPIQL